MSAAMHTRAVSHRAAVSSLSAALVHGATRSATVVATTRLGCYLLLDGGTQILPVVTADALALPTAARLSESSATRPLRLGLGEPVRVGGSRITAEALVVEVVRTVRPAQVRRLARGRPHTPLPAERARELLGRGPGLTPEGDDELAGHLLVLAAVGGVIPELERDLHRTTALSASLLLAAAEGYAVPQVVAYVDALLAGDTVSEDRLRPVVAAIGHTSGPALLRGIDTALDRTSQPSLERTVA